MTQRSDWYEPPLNLVDLWEASVVAHSSRPLFGIRQENGTFRWISYGETARRVDDLRAGLAELGIGTGNVVGIIANNRPEWAIAAFATYGRGARFVPMYEAELPSVWHYIIKDAGVNVLLVASAKVRDALGDVAVLPRLRCVIVIDDEGADSLVDLERAGHASPVPSLKPGPLDVAGILYTSGTTGSPKGVLLTHGNFTSNTRAGHNFYTFLGPDDRGISILPWAHAYGQTGELYHFISIGASIGIAGSPATLAADMLEVRPTYFITVPRVFNRIYEVVWSTVRDAGGLKLWLFESALRAARRKRETGRAGISWWLLNRLVCAQVRNRFGGRLKGALSGSARMNPEIAQFFFDIGVPVYDCYGLSETSPAVSMNCPAAYKLGTVGRPVEKVTVTIDTSRVDDDSGDGEIVVHGPNVMSGYHNKPEETAAVITEDGGFRTGDRGHIDADGFLHITGRFKEQYKLLNGKYVFPAAIEEEIKLIPYVLNTMVFGEGKPANECIVVPNIDHLRRHAHELGFAADPAMLFQSHDELGRAVRVLVGKDIMAHLRGRFASYEIPRRFHFVTEDFTVANGLLTQTLKVKRREVVERFGSEITANPDPQLDVS